MDQIYLGKRFDKNAQTTTTQALTDSINSSNLVIAGDARMARVHRIGKFEGWELRQPHQASERRRRPQLR